MSITKTASIVCLTLLAACDAGSVEYGENLVGIAPGIRIAETMRSTTSSRFAQLNGQTTALQRHVSLRLINHDTIAYSAGDAPPEIFRLRDDLNLWVSENSPQRVISFSQEGNQIGQYGGFSYYYDGLADANDEGLVLDVFAVGHATSALAVDFSVLLDRTATYTGDLVYHRQEGGVVVSGVGDIVLNADFGAEVGPRMNAELDMDNLQIIPTSAALINEDGSFAFDELFINDGDDLSDATLTGQFYGPNASEVGGAVTFANGEVNYTGAYYATE